MRLLRVYVRGGEFAVHSEALVEAEPTPGRFALAEVVDATREEVVEALREAASFLRRQGDAGVRRAIEKGISERMRSGETDAVYELEMARQSLESLHEQIEEALSSVPSGPARVRRGVGSQPKRRARARLHRRTKPLLKAEALSLLAEATFLERVLGRGEAGQDCHAVFIELLRLGEGVVGPRPLVESSGLVPWLVETYRRARGECDGVAARRRGESLLTLPDEPNAALDLLPTERPDHVVMKMVGLHVVDFFEGETGCHVWESVQAGTEVLRVRAVPAPVGTTAAEIIETHLARRRAFDQALEAGTAPLPENPESLLPIVRSIRFDPPRSRGQVAPLTIEDYGLADARHGEMSSPHELLAELLSVRMTKLEEPPEGAGG